MKKGEWRPARIRALKNAIRGLRARNSEYYASIILEHQRKIKKFEEAIERDKKKELLK